MQLLIDEGKQSSLIKWYWRLIRRVLSEIQQPVIDMADQVSPEQLKHRVAGLMKEDRLRDVINDIWVKQGSHFALQTLKTLDKIPKKADPKLQVDWWEDYFRRYTRERTAKILKEIMDSQAEIVNVIIDRNIAEGISGGLGIPEMQRYLRTDLIDSLTEMNKYQAERIARTEVIGASNKGSYSGAKESGLDIKKIWLTSGLDGVRESHLQYEAEDAQTDGRGMDEQYASGLQYPADPDGSPEEIINCRCTIVYNVDEGQTFSEE